MVANALHPAYEPSSRWLRARIEDALERAVMHGASASPPRLRAAIAHAVFAGGARLRPQLCLGVAMASGGMDAAALARATSSAVAVEMIHCASLVHDDLPCFDDAALRRGQETVHRRFGEPIAVLAGDALIVLAFQTLGRARAYDALGFLAEATGPSRGIIAGQAWESEVAVPLDEYHRAKTASLFEAAAGMGALAAHVDPSPWCEFGEIVGRAYQAADDVADSAGKGTEKTNGRDAALGRPSVVAARGVEGARARVKALIEEARAAIPACPGESMIVRWLAGLDARIATLG